MFRNTDICTQITDNIGTAKNLRSLINSLWFANFCSLTLKYLGTAVAKWLRCCATNQKVAGSIPAGVSGFCIGIKFFLSHYNPGVDSASNRNEYLKHFLVVKAAGV